MKKTVSLTIVTLVLLSLLSFFHFVPTSSSHVKFDLSHETMNTQGASTTNQTVMSMNLVTTLGTTNSTGYYTGANVAAPLFDGCIIFWRNTANNNFCLTALNLTTQTFSDVWTSQGKNLPSDSECSQQSTTVIGNTLYAAYTCQSAGPPYFTSTVVYTTDLSTFTTLGDVSMVLESMCNYTGGGTYNNTLYFGGYQSYGFGTYTVVDAWYNGADKNVWSAPVWHSNDCCFLTMYNSTCMIGSQANPNNIIYTNDGVNFAQEYNGVTGTFPTQYPFDWAWGVYVTSGTAYMAAVSSPTSLNGYYYGGMATWSGLGTYTPTSWNPVNLYCVSNNLTGGSDNLLNSSGWTGSPAIYTYNSAGGLVNEIWCNSSAVGAVLSLVYDNNVWYGLYYDTVSKNATVITINIAQVVGGSGGRMPYID